MPESNRFIHGVFLMVLSAGAIAQPVPTSAVTPSADIFPASGADAKPPVSVTPAGPVESVPVFPGSGVTVGQLEAQQEMNLLLEAQVQTARLKKQLAEANTQSATDSVPQISGLSAGIPVTAGTVPAQPVAKKNERITVLEVSGRGKNLQATLAFPDGRRSVVQAGSPLPGTTLTVKTISLSSVTLSDGRQLTF